MAGNDAHVLHGRRILAIDDSPEALALIRFLLEKAGAEVKTVENGNDGLLELALAENDYDAVVCDLEMPEFDGIETVRGIRDVEYDGPVVGVTATVDFDRLAAWSVAGCDLIVSKPLDRGSLVGALSNAIAKLRPAVAVSTG